MPDFPPPSAAEVEGDYSSYSQKWVSATLAVIAGKIIDGAIDVASKRVYFRGTNDRFVVLNLDDGTIITEVDVASYGTYGKTFGSSVYGKYIVALYPITGVRYQDIKIWKNGSLLQTLTVAGADFWATNGGVIISYNGQYIIAYDETSLMIYCFQGS